MAQVLPMGPDGGFSLVGVMSSPLGWDTGWGWGAFPEGRGGLDEGGLVGGGLGAPLALTGGWKEIQNKIKYTIPIIGGIEYFMWH